MNEKMIEQAAVLHRDLIMTPYNEILDAGGFDALRVITHLFGGSSIYVPNLRTILGKCIEKEIQRQYRGTNVRELARNFGYGERHIRNLLRQ